MPADFYRQALDLDLKGKREYTAAIYAAMGGVSDSMARLKNANRKAFKIGKYILIAAGVYLLFFS